MIIVMLESLDASTALPFGFTRTDLECLSTYSRFAYYPYHNRSPKNFW